MNNSKNCWTVYCHTTPSGKRYIGITSKKPEHRWRNGKGYEKGSAFRRAIDKYGWNDIQHNILFNDLTEKEAKWLENYLICYYWTFVGFKDSKGYNMTLGGEGSLGYVKNEETRRKHSESNKGKNKGKTSWSKGKHLSEEHKRKIGESNKGHTPWKGKHHTEEEKKRIRTSLIGHQSSIKGKHWKLIDGKHVYYE